MRSEQCRVFADRQQSILCTLPSRLALLGGADEGVRPYIPWRPPLHFLVHTTASPIDDLFLSSVLCNVTSKTSEMSRLRVADDITKLVGETPMLQLKRLVPPRSADIFAKLEYLNPGGSVKE